MQTNILAYIIKENKSSNGITFLSKKVMGGLLGLTTVTRVNELSEIVSDQTLYSLDSACKEKAELFEWNINSSDFILLPEDSFKKRFDYDTEKIIKKHWLFWKKVVKEANASNTYIRTSPIMQHDNFLFIYVSSQKGTTLGSSCLYVFEINEEQNIELKKKVYCYIH